MDTSLHTKSKKELKARAKIAKQSDFPEYIHLSIASIEEIISYLEKYEIWLQKASERAAQNKEIELFKQQSAQVEAEKIVKNRLATIAQLERELERPLPLSEVGEKVASYLNQIQGYRASTWNKNGEMRIYLKDVSYINPKNAGYIKVDSEGEIKTYFTRAIAAELVAVIERLQQIIRVASNDLIAVSKSRTPDQIQAAIKAGVEVSYQEISHALDAMYGRGGWDDRDREDFEG